MGAFQAIGLLVSVRSATEAEAALTGGADVVDIKEPAHGSLGRATDRVIAAVIARVAGRRPVSAAFGEIAQTPQTWSGVGLSFAKWGLAGCRHLDWPRRLETAMEQLALSDPGCCVVPVAYADWECANAPPPVEVAAFAREHRCAAWLVDTWVKDGRTLLDWFPESHICDLKESAGIPLALAGSLRLEHVPVVRRLQPAWLAVRGAACLGGRSGAIDAASVARLAKALRGARESAACES